MAKWLQQFEKWIGKGNNGSKRIRSFRWLLLLGLVGAALILFGSFQRQESGKGSVGGKSSPGREPQALGAFDSLDSKNSSLHTSSHAFESIEQSFEARIKSILEEIVGVGQVDVLITIDSTEELIVQRNFKDNQQQTEETDAKGGKRHNTQYTRDGQIVTLETSGNLSPIVTKRIKPKVRGVIVVAKGVENSTVKKMVVDAVEKGLNVPAYRVSVVPRKIAE